MSDTTMQPGFSPLEYVRCWIVHRGHEWTSERGHVLFWCGRCGKKKPDARAVALILLLAIVIIAPLYQLRQKLRFDRRGGQIAGLLVAVAAVTAWLAIDTGGAVERAVGSSPPGTSVESSGGEAAAGAAWVGLEVAFAIGLLLAILALRRAPSPVRTLAKHNLAIASAYYLGARGEFVGSPGTFLLVVIGAYSTWFALDRLGLWWIANNTLSVALAVGLGLVIGEWFGVAGMLVALLGLTAYDHVFANKQSWMFALAAPMLRARLPVIFVVPTTWRYEWSNLLATAESAEAGADPERAEEWGLGTADLAIVAGFVAAVASSSVLVPTGVRPVAVVAVLAGLVVAALRLSHELETTGSGAGLPALAAGMVVPYGAVVAGWLAVVGVGG